MNNLLTNREYKIYGDWNTPKEFLLENFKSVIDVKLTNTTSSAGDWDGIIFQQIGKTIHIISFSQENNWPKVGSYTIYTGEQAVMKLAASKLTPEVKDSIVEQYCEIAWH